MHRPSRHADILKAAQPMLAKEGVTLEIIEFTDYVQPNMALADKELDANFFQHKPYLDNFAKERKTATATACGRAYRTNGGLLQES